MNANPADIPDAVAQVDPRELIHEAYRIEGITSADCRTIFLDWSLGETGSVAPRHAVERLLAHYGADASDHPMTHVLRAALQDAPVARRRGGYKSRPRD